MRIPLIFAACCVLISALKTFAYESERELIVSVPDQRLAVLENGIVIAEYRVSTSKYGVGDRSGSYATPPGELQVAEKIGDGVPIGTVFKNRHPTGEILRPNASGRDPIVTRILWLRGLEAKNSQAFERNIYIHGTPVERLIGRPASYGCIRMRSRDVVQVFNMVHTGAKVEVVNEGLDQALAARVSSHANLAAN